MNVMNVASIPTEFVDPPANVVQTSSQPAAAPRQKRGVFKTIKYTLHGLNGVQAGIFFIFIFVFMFGITLASGFGYLYGLLAGGIGIGVMITAIGTACGLELKWWWCVTFVTVSVCGFSGGMAVGSLYPAYLRVEADTFVLDTVLEASKNRNAYAVKFSSIPAVDISVWGEMEGTIRKMEVCNVVAPLRDAGAPTGTSAVATVVAICAVPKPCSDGGVDECLAWLSDPKNVHAYGAARFDSPVIPYSLVNYYSDDHDEALSKLRAKMDPGTLPASVLVFRLVDWEAEQKRKKEGCIVTAAVCIPFGMLFVALGARWQHLHFQWLRNLPSVPGEMRLDDSQHSNYS